jgi:biotin carboxyl carrier protein
MDLLPAGSRHVSVGALSDSSSSLMAPSMKMWTRRKCAAARSPAWSSRSNVEPGQTVEANDLIMVLEAMKMETNVTAPGTREK